MTLFQRVKKHEDLTGKKVAPAPPRSSLAGEGSRNLIQEVINGHGGKGLVVPL